MPMRSSPTRAGRSKPTLIDYVQDRNGKVIFRTDNRCAVMGNCNAADWDGKAMPRPPSRTRQLIDPMAAFQMVHIMEGVIERGTATVLRDLNRPLFGKTGTTSGPTNVWFVGGTPDIVAGVYLGYDQPRSHGRLCPGRPDRGADLQADGRRSRSQDLPKVPFVAPAGIRWVRIDRGERQAGLWDVSDPGGPEVAGDLGGVPAADRAAPLVPPRLGRSVQARRIRASDDRTAARPAAADEPRPAGSAPAATSRAEPQPALQTQNSRPIGPARERLRTKA